MLARVSTDIDDTNFILGNTRAEIPRLLQRVDDSEATRQLALTDSEEEDTAEDRASDRSALVRTTIKKREAGGSTNRMSG
eukprot:COSAG06_NODE_21750_length_746_cov_3.060278_2_plen_79_part_01